MKLRIRPARKEDLPDLLSLVRRLAEFENLAPPGPDAVRRYRRHGSGAAPFFRALLALADGKPVGYAFFFFTYSTFLARPTLYLEDLFVLPELRNRGVGAALLRALGGIARRKGCGRIEWTVLDWNVGARRFYRRFGARRLSRWHLYRLDGEALRRLTGDGDRRTPSPGRARSRSSPRRGTSRG